MAIDRAPFNALVDDDGSNTIGTPWNKAAIASVILDPVDAAIVAGPMMTLLAAGSGQSANPNPENLVSAGLPALTLRDVVHLAIVASFGGGATPLVLDLALIAPTFFSAITLTGATGAGDLIPSSVGMFEADIRPLPPGPVNVETRASGAITAGLAQSRGATFAALCQADVVSAGSTVTLRQLSGIPGGGILYWAWSVYLLKG